ncbi:RNA polymerase sigma factor RpoH, partial [Chitinimonas sp.]|uniref:RNA polymerase sigma factor RpoH n=1 Tax=Chitinimonas sp. TaxID=1934313 RepID=UPI002F94FFC3
MTTMTLPVIASGDSLDRYIQQISAIPLLTQEEESDLAKRLHEQNDLEAAGKLVMSHLRVVVSIARGYAGYGLPQADLIQEGNIGLMKAVKRFEPTRGVRLFSFAVHWIRAEIHEYILRNWRLVRIATTKAQRKLFFNLRSMKSSMNALTHQEAQQIADDLGVKREEVLEMETRMSGHDVALVAEDGDEDSYAPIDWLADNDNEPVAVLERRAVDYQHGEGLQAALDTLDARSRRIVEA